MGIHKVKLRLTPDKWGADFLALVLLVFVFFSPAAQSADCIKLCEGGKHDCLNVCSNAPTASKIAACSNACYSTYDCPARCANPKSPIPQSQPSAQKNPTTQCNSACNQQYSQCAMTCQGKTSCFETCGSMAKNCFSACGGLSNSTSSSQSQGQSKTQEVLNKVDSLNKAVQGIFGAGE